MQIPKDLLDREKARLKEYKTPAFVKTPVKITQKGLKNALRVKYFSKKFTRHIKGPAAGEPHELMDWQFYDLVLPVFGQLKPDGTRKVRTAYVEVPRKNSKSTLASMIAIYMLIADGEKGAEIYSAAADRNQASIVFNTAREMVLASPELKRIIKVTRNTLVYKTNVYKAISADSYRHHGTNPSCVIFDELHVQPNRELWDTLTTGMGARAQPLMIALTTAGTDKLSVCYELHEYTEKVAKGTLKDETFYGVIYSVNPKSDIFDEKVWATANPGYNICVRPDYLEMQANKVKTTPSFASAFKRLHLNIWTGAAETWITDNVWKGNTVHKDPVKFKDVYDRLKGRTCYGGLDLAASIDLNAFVLIFPPEDFDGKIDVLPIFWIPEAKIYNNKDGVDYETWKQQGFVNVTPGNVVDHKFITEHIKKCAVDFDVQGIAYDRYLATHGVIQDLSEDELPVYPIGQGFVSMSQPTKDLERLATEGAFETYDNPVLAWNMSNVTIERDPADNIKITKKRSKSKVDGAVALVMSIAMMNDPEIDEEESVYDSRGILSL